MTHPAWTAPDKRVVCWFSCGVTSAVAAKIAIDRYKDECPVIIYYTDPGGEHEDNKRFLKDCEKWFGHEITTLRSKKYNDIWEVFEKTRWLVGPGGARCTTELKKKLRIQVQEPHRDIQVFGFDAAEAKRAERFEGNNPEVCLWTPLLEQNITKRECLQRLAATGIELPVMYQLGYRNNNCIGCVKGGAGYWNKIRRDFPDVFERMSKVERHLNVAINKTYKGGNGRQRVFLDELPPDAGRYKDEPPVQCSIYCGETLDEEPKGQLKLW